MPGLKELSDIAVPLATFGVAGGFGGAVAALNLVRMEKVLSDGRTAFGGYLRLLHCLLSSALTGIAGGLVARGPIFVQIRADESGSPTLVMGILFAIVGGFGGVRGLEIARSKMLPEQVAAQVNQVQNEQKRIQGVMSEEKSAQDVYMQGIGVATLELSIADAQTSPQDVLATALTGRPATRQGTELLEKAKRLSYASDRFLGVLLGRLYRWSGDLKTANQTLADMLAVRRAKGIPASLDDAVLW